MDRLASTIHTMETIQRVVVEAETVDYKEQLIACYLAIEDPLSNSVKTMDYQPNPADPAAVGKDIVFFDGFGEPHSLSS